MDDSGRDIQCRKDLLSQIPCPEPDRARILAGMASEHLILKHILIDGKLYPVLLVVHESKYRYAPGRDIQELLHLLFISEGKAADPHLF